MKDRGIISAQQNTSERTHREATRLRLAAIVECSDDAIFGNDLDSIVTDWNPGAERIFGYTADEMLGTSILRLIPADRPGEEDFFLGKIRRGEKVDHFETLRKTKDGRLIHVSITALPIRDDQGSIIGASKIARDVTGQKEHERQLSRMTRLYASLRHITQAIVWTSTREELFRKVCRILVEHGGFHMAWIGRHDPESCQISPVAAFGKETDYLQTVKIVSDDRPEGQGPTGRAVATGGPCICNDMHHNPVTLPWRPQLAQRGFQAATGFPIRLGNEVWGALTVYSEEPWFFQDKEIALLQEAARDISFALDNFAAKDERQQVEKVAENERLFSATMIESMPGILYFYDEQGRFLRWNRNFEIVSGYSADEIRRIHPLDFFKGQDRELLQNRIAEVFERGDSFVEAEFVSKDGRATPFFFTGRRVRFNGMQCLVGMGIDISERKLAENRLAESERKYRELVENANSIILRWNSEGRVTFINEFGQRFFGYSAEEILGRELVGTIVPVTESSGRDLQRLMHQISAAPKAFEQNVNENIQRNGQRVWISWTNHIVHDQLGRVQEILSIGTDITEQRRANDALRRSEEQFRLIMENLADLVAVLDLDGRRLYNSPSYQEIIGEPAQLRGSSSFHELHPDDQARVRQAFEDTVRTGVGQRLEYRLVDQNGRSRDIESQGSVIRDSQGRVAQVIVVSRDVTERRQAEQVIRDLNANLERRVAERTAELETALIRAEAADRLKSAFLATMSHELRTPLNSIIGFTGIVLQGLAGPLNAEQAKQLGMVRASSRHLLELINDVLDLSKIEAGQLEVRAEPFNLRDALEHVTALVKPMTDRKGIVLSVEASAELDEMISDRRRVEQILLNLVNNAIKFTPSGQVTIRAELAPAYHPPGGSKQRPAVRLRVKDTGVGIKPEDLPSLFQPFQQLDAGIARQHEGTGLGLAICRRLTTLLGGEVSVTSVWGQGSEFTVILPLRKPPAL